MQYMRDKSSESNKIYGESKLNSQAKLGIPTRDSGLESLKTVYMSTKKHLGHGEEPWITWHMGMGMGIAWWRAWITGRDAWIAWGYGMCRGAWGGEGGSREGRSEN